MVPQVVEAVLARADGVRECAVAGLPDERLGQAVVAAVVPAPGRTPDPAGLRATVAAELGPHAAPRVVFLVDRLPLRGPGKLDRRALAEQLARRAGPATRHDA